MQILQIILLVVSLLGLAFGKWVGIPLGKLMVKIAENPYGAVFLTIALLVFLIGLINWLISLGKINNRKGN